VCGAEMKQSADGQEVKDDWILAGQIDDKLSADFARETLTSYDIPVVIMSRSGFFGNVGLTMNPFYDSQSSAAYEVHVPASMLDEASELLNMTIGAKWHRKDT
jgi:hypothetical protein